MRWNTIRQSVRIGIVVTLLVVATFGTTGIAAGAAEEEPNNGQEEAQEVSTGEEVTGELTSGDVDYYRFTVESGTVINISAYSDGVGNTNVELLDRNGNQRTGISGLTDQNGQAGATSTYSGTHYVRVERRFSDRGGEYSFTIETSDSDDFEPNEDPANATELIDEEEVGGELTIGDTDWFTISAEEGDDINVTAYADANGATNVQLYDRNGTLLNGQDGLTGQFARFNHTATYTGAYNVRLTSRFGNYGATYNLTVDLPGEPQSQDSTTNGSEADEADDGGLPLVPLVAGVAIVLLVLVAVARRRDEDDESL
jgi:hypothetical protein